MMSPFFRSFVRWLRFFLPFLILTGVFPACFKSDHPPRILVFSKTAGYRHASIPAGVAALRQLCRENGMLMDTTEDAAAFEEKNLCRYAAVVFLSTTGDVLDPAQETAFERYIQAGGGYVGIHAASDTEYSWGWYGKLVGGYFDSHPEIQDATLLVQNHQHPATRHLGDTWQRHDEWYNLRDLNPQVNILLKIDEKSYQGGKMGEHHPMSWYHEYDGGRAFYTALGHTEASFSEPDFLKHILGGIQYAVGQNKRLNYKLCRTAVLPDPTRFVKTVLASELNEPMELDMFPDGKIIFIERRGAIKLFHPNTGLISIAYKLPVYDKQEDGLLGLALDPHWEQNHWIYLYYSPPGDKPVNNLSRFRFVDDTLDRASEIVLLEVPVQREECCHAGGSLEFDGEGNLYLSTGDNTNPFASSGYDPIDERPGRSAWDAQKSSANSNDLRGKILRIKPLPDGTYVCPEGNLPGAWPAPAPPKGGSASEGFSPGNGAESSNVQPISQSTPETHSPPTGGAGRGPIYIMGCRNPFRISLDNRRRLLFWGDVGPDAGEPDTARGPAGQDEVNRARAAGFFGWPYFVGNNKPYRDYDFKTKQNGPAFDPGRPQNDSPNNTGVRELPPAQPAMIWYGYGNSEEFPLLGNGSRSAMAGPVYYCDEYPAETRLPDSYDGKLIIYEWMRGWMMAVTLDSLGNFSRMEPFAENLRFSRPMDMIVDKKGSIWVLEYGKQWFASNPDARLSRIDYVRGNRPPAAALRSDKLAGAAPCTVLFSAADTRDYDGDQLRYEMDFGDGSPMLTIATNKTILAEAGLRKPGDKKGSAPVDSIRHIFARAGNYEVTLTVTDPHGASASVRQKIAVGNEPPTVFWDLEGKNRSFYEPGEILHYSLHVDDPEDGSLDNGTIPPEAVAASIDYLETGFDITQIAQGHQAAETVAEYARGKILIDRSDCTACHAVDRTVNGPAFQAVAERYRKNEIAVRDLTRKVIKGGAGNWGETVMSAHPQLSEADAGEMIRWILSLAKPPKPKETIPLKGEYALKAPRAKAGKKKTAPGAYILKASYRDRGSRAQAPLTGAETIALRPAFQQAEQADSTSREVRTYRPFDGDTVVLNELKHNSFFMFRHCDLRGIYSVAINVGSGDARYPAEGGRIELRVGSPEGRKAGAVTVPKGKGGNQTFTLVTLEIDQAVWPRDGSYCDLYFVLKNENYPSKIVAPVDWIRFNL